MFEAIIAAFFITLLVGLFVGFVYWMLNPPSWVGGGGTYKGGFDLSSPQGVALLVAAT
ncbi:hypothetical protein SEA_KUDEFRE_105 [Gordonia phage Kudefre]|uniref:Uncharacterized protein n=1 Tax=Gordonia phage Kudefre TaxID=2885975 RepID=A0AAE9C2D7_9CAUD|nr:hypothetical protein L3Y24_gp137 [Gordonia phage Kudefre]UDL15324.1 hypothetical protein SEA_KUDEFRE_105 [Gordonia phage Kudefre]